MSVSTAHRRRSAGLPWVKTPTGKSASVGWRPGSDVAIVAVRSSIPWPVPDSRAAHSAALELAYWSSRSIRSR
ncbi:hypothetical protein CEY15_16130 [Dietzia natronolimnaea]|uniref:Uncharacterized protein n=1 Tax=Dietzia natronolimnaea TaxID=161920 RepID=A0A2A2WLB5_9ACTN|nr:hypothetical protein CEY15_16130 [Dietzia natronolimnaea]